MYFRFTSCLVFFSIANAISQNLDNLIYQHSSGSSTLDFRSRSGVDFAAEANISGPAASGELSMLGRWTDKELIEPAVVKINIKTQLLDWSTSTLERSLGRAGDLLLTGDFNGNGITDGLVGRINSSGRAEWDLLTDIFTQADNAAPQSFEFGKSGDRGFIAKAEAGESDWLCTVRAGEARISKARCRSFSGVVKGFTRFPAFAAGSDRPRPFAITQDSAPDILAFTVNRGANALLRFTTIEGRELGRYEFDPAGSSIAVGNFNELPGFELAINTTENLSILNPLTGEERVLPTIPGKLISQVNAAVIKNAGSVTDTSPTTSNNTGTSAGLSSVCKSVSNWPSTWVYKTIGSTHFTDSRRNAVGLIMKIGASGPFSECIDVISTQGKSLAKLGRYSVGAGWAARYYATFGCGSSSNVNGSKLAALANSSSGSSSIYMRFNDQCFGPIDANQCIGSGQC